MPKETPELPVSPQEVQIQAPTLLNKLKIHKLKILGGILGVFIFAGAVFGAYKFGQKQIQPGSQPIPTPGLVATPTPNLTADWKTYTNSLYNFSFNYPHDWYLNVPPLEGKHESNKSLLVVDVLNDLDFKNKLLLTNAKDVLSIRITVWEKNGLDFNSALGDWDKFQFNSLIEATSFKEIGLIKWMVREIKNNAGVPIIEYILEKNNNIFVISIAPRDSDFIGFSNLMLSTFKFLEESDEAQIKKVLDEYIPEHSLVKVFELEGLKILGNFAKLTVVPKDVVTDKAMVILEKSGGEWSVIWGPGTAIGKTDPVFKKIPEGLLE